MIVTYAQATVDFWEAAGFAPELLYTIDGISYYQVDVPPESAQLQSPDYLKLVMDEQAKYPDILRVRFAPPIYTVKFDGRFAVTPSKEIKGAFAIPMSRDKQILEKMFLTPKARPNQVPDFPILKSPRALLNAIVKTLQRKFADRIAFFISPGVAETFDARMVATILSQDLQQQIVLPDAPQGVEGEGEDGDYDDAEEVPTAKCKISMT